MQYEILTPTAQGWKTDPHQPRAGRLVTCFYVFSASALVPHGHAAEYAEYYIYKDPYGRLVISNKLPPDRSSILKKHHLREPAEEVPQPQETADPQPNGGRETSPQPQKSK
jgi:hypothetical protein